MQLNYQELLQYFNAKDSTVRTNFPRFCQKKLAQGILITKEGKGSSAIYTIEKVKPQLVSKDKFSCVSQEILEDLPNEQWVDLYLDNTFEVSDLGRIRYKKDKRIKTTHISKNGYIQLSIKYKTYLLHRLILQSFCPREDYNDLTVDHINGIKTDNSLKNLRWCTGTENTLLMLTNRADLNKELTRIINIIGYEETLELLKTLPD